MGHLAHAALGVGSFEAGIATSPHFLEPRLDCDGHLHIMRTLIVSELGSLHGNSGHRSDAIE